MRGHENQWFQNYWDGGKQRVALDIVASSPSELSLEYLRVDPGTPTVHTGHQQSALPTSKTSYILLAGDTTSYPTQGHNDPKILMRKVYLM